LLNANDEVMSEFVTDETIRPYSADELVRFARSAGLLVESVVVDYGASVAGNSPRFATVVARKSA
jgi:hypothetical protein